MRPLWTVAGHPVPDPGAWSARLRAAVALLLGCLVWAAALPVGWALKGWFGASAALVEAAAPAASAAAPIPAIPPKAPVDEHPAHAHAPAALQPRAANDLWRLPGDLASHPGLSLAWFRPLAPSSPGEPGTPGGVSLRVLGAYRHLVAWLDELPPALAVRSLKLSTAAVAAREVHRVHGAEPVLALEATLEAAPGRPLQEALVDTFAAKPQASARDPFAAPWTDSGPAQQPSVATTSVEGSVQRPLELVGVLAREGHTWSLLQVDGRLLPVKETHP